MTDPTTERSVEDHEAVDRTVTVPLISSLPAGKMDSPNSARFRLVSRGDIPATPADRGTADERGGVARIDVARDHRPPTSP